MTIAYATDAFGVSGALRPLPNFARYFVFPFLESRKRLQKTIRRANEILVPVIESHYDGKGDNLDLLQWMILGAKDNDKKPTELVRKALFLTLASIVSSAMSITHAIFDLCAYPEYVKPLREEIETVLQREGGWTLQGIDSMYSLDSFLKESQRINHPGLCKLTKP
jgi:cytochrome P450